MPATPAAVSSVPVSSEPASSEQAWALIAIVCTSAPVHRVLNLRGLDCAIRLVTGAKAAASEEIFQPADLVIVMHDPEGGIDGLTVVRNLRSRECHARTAILVLGTPAALRRASVEAGATDVMIEPIDPLDLQIRVCSLIELTLARQLLDRQSDAMNRNIDRARTEAALREREIIRRLMLAAEFRDDQAGDHLTRVAGCAIAIAEGLGLSEADANDIALASTMHDIGKISIPDSILMKPGPLSESEREEMKQHAIRGYRMLHDSPSHLLQLASDIALTHHERWDGGGYPQGLGTTQIPLAGRIVAVADVFDALISERVYKKAWTPEAARRHLEEHAGTHFDPACVAAFVSRWDDILGLVESNRPETAAVPDA
ncbi:HD domain-containing phosphohydrolase [Methylobacterium sp. 77]|uniref:HD-GYP domain-containing protein n=1 Tax=Methylobacterium sp. 77 TaxID=1101192 RepID=UPI000378E9E4|nr:HD domain-containing phosphohydrolase [Methylobacterium sp. 77]